MSNDQRPRPYIVVARVERDDLTGDVTLRLIADETVAELHDGDEFLTVAFTVDPFTPAKG